MDALQVYALLKKKINSKFSSLAALSPFEYKGSVANYDTLPTNATKGNLYSTSDTADEYLWSGTEWIKFGNEVTMDMILALQNGKQNKLTSGTNIKTVNGNSILGSGNLELETGAVDDIRIDGVSIVSDKVANITTTYKVTIES